MALLEVDNLKTWFHTRNGVVRAVDGISFSLEKGKTLGIVGESGSGKSVSCYSLLDLIPKPPGKIESGSAMFDGADLLTATPKQIRAIRGQRISMIFQDPMTALNPYMTIGAQLIEPLLVHSDRSKSDARDKAIAMLEAVGIQDAPARMKAYPHHFSGGMRQRVVIAIALACGPELVIADEPTTALDVTIQAQILQLINNLQRDSNMAVILITHDLGVIAETCDEVCVMYAGRIVEQASARELFANPRHAYTQGLLNSIPRLNGKPKTELNTIDGMVPALMDLKPGCRFAPRSGREHKPELLADRQPMKEISPDHWVEACPVCTMA